MGELGALFNPGMRHELEERQSKAARREEEGNARDGDLRIDLESGVAVINVPSENGAAPAESATEATSAPTTTASSADSAAAEPSAASQSSAAAADPGDADSGTGQAKPEPAPLRPRGKRSMTASHR